MATYRNYDENYWDWRMANAHGDEEVRAVIDGMLLNMSQAGIISMSWDDEKEDFVFYMDEMQKKAHDMGHS
jgi:hypothetical protein|tara:strand:- start:1278 stop:1490 length:213 start_codon:yes stop_codon:yes gene_type:complete